MRPRRLFDATPSVITGSAKSTPEIVTGLKRSRRVCTRIKSRTSSTRSSITTGCAPRRANSTPHKQQRGCRAKLPRQLRHLSQPVVFTGRTATRIRLQPHRTERYNSREEQPAAYPPFEGRKRCRGYPTLCYKEPSPSSGN